MKDIPTGKDLGFKSVRGRLMEVKEVAEFLRVSARWVHLQMQKGTFPIPWRLIGVRGRVVDSADLDEYLQKIVINAGSVPVELPLKAVRKIIEEEVRMS